MDESGLARTHAQSRAVLIGYDDLWAELSPPTRGSDSQSRRQRRGFDRGRGRFKTVAATFQRGVQLRLRTPQRDDGPAPDVRFSGYTCPVRRVCKGSIIGSKRSVQIVLLYSYNLFIINIILYSDCEYWMGIGASEGNTIFLSKQLILFIFNIIPNSDCE